MVAAQETTLRKILEGSKQYQVPLFQRVYSWSSKQIDQLWDDIVETAETRLTQPHVTHFIGSLVLATTPDIGPAGLNKYLVVDGQQRLTTLTLLLAAIRDHLVASGQEATPDRIDEQYLINKWEPGQPTKLLPTSADREAYLAVIRRVPSAERQSRVKEAYHRFQTKLVELDVAAAQPDCEGMGLTVKNVESTVLSGLSLVAVTASEEDNAFRIFESLNNTGLKLTQADLLKNYLFMRLGDRGQQVYESTWRPLEKRLSSDELELLFWLDVLSDDDRARRADTFERQQRRLSKLSTVDQLEREVGRIAKLGELLETVLRPSSEADPEVRRHLSRIVAWGVTAAYPVVLELLRRREAQTATSVQVADALTVLESYLVRRVVTATATTVLNRILAQAVEPVHDAEVPAEGLRTYLSGGRRHFATDAQVRDAVHHVPFYLQGRASQRKLILMWLDEGLGSKEHVDSKGLTIEHVMPQSLSAEWRKALEGEIEPGADVDEVHRQALHTLGNLTLTGYNSEMSNGVFAVKRPRLQHSGLLMNQSIADQESWGPEQIAHRADTLAEEIITLWPGPDESLMVRSGDQTSEMWRTAATIISAIPAGRWTTCDAVATLVGTDAVLLDSHLATTGIREAYRVIQSGGTIPDRSEWMDSARKIEPKQLLEADGVRFDASGHAAPEQEMSVEDLALECGITVPETAAERFEAQLAQHQEPSTVEAVHRLMNHWAMRGWVQYGTGASVTAFFMADANGDHIWPIALSPTGKVEVVFQYLARREPFTDEELRKELRLRFNSAPGVDLEDRPRPGFLASSLSNEAVFDVVQETLDWFLDEVDGSIDN